MWRALAALIIVTGACGRSSKPAVTVQLGPGLQMSTTDEGDAAHVVIRGDDVALQELPLADAIGLPMTGRAEVMIDVRIPVMKGQRDYSRASGTVAARCLERCLLGGQRTPWKMGTGSTFASEIVVPQIDLGAPEASGVLVNGGGKLTMSLISKDLELAVTMEVALAPRLEDAVVDACVRFKPTADVRSRDPRLVDLLVLIGAPVGADGMHHIRLTGQPRALKRAGELCDGTSPVP
jgi:hypothetical protein